MYTEVKEGLYQCDECFRTLKTEKGMKNHVAKVHTANKVRESVKAEMEDIRLTSVSIHEVVDRLRCLWLKHGLKVVITSYPSHFENSVRNSHNAPMGEKTNWSGEGHLPKGYPGWSGRWTGHVEVVDKVRWGSRVPYFTCLFDGHRGRGSDGVFVHAPWINTGSGGGGDNFQYSGMFFIQDFPEMYKEFKQKGGCFKVLEKDYMDSVEAYRARFDKEKREYVKSAAYCKEADNVLSKVSQLSDEVRRINDKTKAYANKAFIESYGVELPKPTSIFVNDEVVKSAAVARTSRNVVLPTLKPTYDRIEALTEQISTYIKDNPEVFI